MEVFLKILENNSYPIIIKIVFVAFLAYLIPVYYKHYGLANFLWFSDLALFITTIAIVFEIPFLISMISVGLLLPEIAWNIDYFLRLLTGKKAFGLSDYMFDDKNPKYIRALSLFHVALPIIWVWSLAEYGYHTYALLPQIIFSWIIILITYLFTKPSENINWVFGLGAKPQKKYQPSIYLLFIIIFYPICIFLPTHFLLVWLFN
jgi:hypothetical protein